jgi:von Willebrand factor type A domain
LTVLAGCTVTSSGTSTDPRILEGVGGSSAATGGGNPTTGGASGTLSSGAGGSTSTSTGDPGGGCNDLDVGFEKVIPTVMLVVDQSGSMTEAFPGGTRWSVLHDALIGVATTLQTDVRFGLTLFTSPKNAVGLGLKCPMITKVPIALLNSTAIKKVYDPAMPLSQGPLSPQGSGDTPTGESLEAITGDLDAFTDPGPKFLILATDGDPDTCADFDPGIESGLQAARQRSIDAVTAAYVKKVGTFVIGVSDDVHQSHLQDLANAGAGLPVGGAKLAKYYFPTNSAEMAAALQAIIGNVRTCVFTLGKMVNLPNASDGTVILDGQKLEYGDPNGWKMITATQLEVMGSACKQIQMDAKAVKISFPCDAIIN